MRSPVGHLCMNATPDFGLGEGTVSDKPESETDRYAFGVASAILNPNQVSEYSEGVLELLQMATAALPPGSELLQTSIQVTPNEWNLGVIRGEGLTGQSLSGGPDAEFVARMFQRDGDDGEVRLVLVTVVLTSALGQDGSGSGSASESPL